MARQPKGAKAAEVFRVEAEGDTLYIKAFTLVEAKAIFVGHMGEVPDPLLTWSGPVQLPEGEEALS